MGRRLRAPSREIHRKPPASVNRLGPVIGLNEMRRTTVQIGWNRVNQILAPCFGRVLFKCRDSEYVTRESAPLPNHEYRITNNEYRIPFIYVHLW